MGKKKTKKYVVNLDFASLYPAIMTPGPLKKILREVKFKELLDKDENDKKEEE